MKTSEFLVITLFVVVGSAAIGGAIGGALSSLGIGFLVSFGIYCLFESLVLSLSRLTAAVKDHRL